MRVLVTGASGHIGSAVVPELIEAGHDVVGLARSETSAATVKGLGAEARRGDVGDLDGLRAAAADVDAVIHLAFDHEAMAGGNFAGAAATDLAAVRAFGDALAGTGKTFVGIGAKSSDDPAQEAQRAANPRYAIGREIAGFSERGVRTLCVAIPQVVHSKRDRSGFVPTLIRIARETGVSAYVGDGANRWPAVHTLDLGHLYRLALEKAQDGAVLDGSTDDGVTVREIAESIGHHLGLPAVGITAEQAAEHFTTFPFITFDNPASSVETRQLLDWRPEHPRLLADLDEGHYFTEG